MSTVQAFNAMMRSFISELATCFPEMPTIAAFLDGFDLMTTLDESKPMKLFLAALAPYTDMVMARDNALFQQPIQLPGGIDLKAIWASDMSDGTREAIWKYITTLYVLGTTVSSLPPEMLRTIENVAQQCASEIKAGNADFGSMTSMLINNMGGLLSGDLMQGAGQDGGGGGLDATALLSKLLKQE